MLLCSIALGSVTTEYETYEGYAIYDVFAENDEQKSLLYRLSHDEDFDFFILPRQYDEPARVMIAPDIVAKFEDLIIDRGLTYKLVNSNVGQSVRKEREQMQNARNIQPEGRISFNAYQRYDQINAYLETLAQNYKNRVTVRTVGRSYEGRDIKAITITNGDYVASKKVILVDAGIHAREWIAPAGALYLINQLVENYTANAALLSKYDWVVVPILNPDGYEYTFTNARMWRKTRKPASMNCMGTDGNRNFDFHWGEEGASPYACSDAFRGQTAFSEPETQMLRDLMLSYKGRAQMYLTLHSYGKYIIYPWGYTSSLPSNWRDIDEVAKAGADAIRAAYNSWWTVGSSTNVLYAAAGGSDDYALAVGQIPISITLELPSGGNGFDPLPSQIDPLVKETWVGIKAMAEKLNAKY